MLVSCKHIKCLIIDQKNACKNIKLIISQPIFMRFGGNVQKHYNPYFVKILNLLLGRKRSNYSETKLPHLPKQKLLKEKTIITK